MVNAVAKYQKYAEYKDSGVEWLGEIPSHWNVSKIGFHTSKIGSGKTPKGGAEIYKDEGVLFLRSQNIYNDGLKIDASESVFITQAIHDDMSTSKVDSGDILLNITGGSIGRSCLIPSNFQEANVNQHVCIIRVRNPLNKFLAQVIKADLIQSQIRLIQTGGNREGLNFEQISKFIFILPPFNEQQLIIKFLDHETAKIDSLIEKQQKLIELLQEKRQAVISHAVTKGLNPDVMMKDSGVEWLGQVPEHWIVKCYRHASKIYRGKFGHRPRNDPAFYDGEYPFIQTGDVARAEKYITHYSQTLNEKGKEVSQLFPEGTLMMAIAANIGDLAILGFQAYAPDSVVGFKPNLGIDLEFLRYSFMAALPALEQTSTQSTQANLNIERIGAVHGVFPSLEEQKEIINFLDTMLNKYQIIKEEMNKAICLLQERRTALISAAVTGKIDVRNWQVPDEAVMAHTV